jgi:hypothetical protein
MADRMNDFCFSLGGMSSGNLSGRIYSRSSDTIFSPTSILTTGNQWGQIPTPGGGGGRGEGVGGIAQHM